MANEKILNGGLMNEKNESKIFELFFKLFILITIISAVIILIIPMIIYLIIYYISSPFICHHDWVEGENYLYLCTKCGKEHQLTSDEYNES